VANYHEIMERSREEIEVLFRTGYTSNIEDGLLSAAYYDPDWRWVQSQCLAFSRHSDHDVRSVAAVCLGHLARIHRQLDVELVLPRLAEMKSDPQVAARVEDAMEDIKFFLRFQ
jgi:hypothetical protein